MRSARRGKPTDTRPSAPAGGGTESEAGPRAGRHPPPASQTPARSRAARRLATPAVARQPDRPRRAAAAVACRRAARRTGAGTRPRCGRPGRPQTAGQSRRRARPRSSHAAAPATRADSRAPRGAALAGLARTRSTAHSSPSTPARGRRPSRTRGPITRVTDSAYRPDRRRAACRLLPKRCRRVRDEHIQRIGPEGGSKWGHWVRSSSRPVLGTWIVATSRTRREDRSST